MQFLANGECVIEMSGGQDGCSRIGCAGDTPNTLWHVRAGLAPERGPVGCFAAPGRDGFPDRIMAFLGVTGAGDSFNGGYLAARLAGAAPEHAAQAGIAMAARVIEAHRAIAHLPGAAGWTCQATSGEKCHGP